MSVVLIFVEMVGIVWIWLMGLFVSVFSYGKENYVN